MQQVLQAKILKKDKLAEGVLATLAFFSLFSLPLTKRRIYELLYETKAKEEEVYQEISNLASLGKVFVKNGLVALKPWDEQRFENNLVEIKKRWEKIDRCLFLFATIPFVEHISVVHSLAIGNVDQKSDVDFFVITKTNQLYFVRSWIIFWFRLLGIYKTRTEIEKQFSLGYYVTSESLDLSKVEGRDAFMAFWFASIVPFLGKDWFEKFVQANSWIYEFIPNYSANFRLGFLRKISLGHRLIKKILEIILFVPAIILEPFLRFIHIRHTFNLPENNWPTSTTVANKDVLKLHAKSQRKQIVEDFEKLLTAIEF